MCNEFLLNYVAHWKQKKLRSFFILFCTQLALIFDKLGCASA